MQDQVLGPQRMGAHGEGSGVSCGAGEELHSGICTLRPKVRFLESDTCGCAELRGERDGPPAPDCQDCMARKYRWRWKRLSVIAKHNEDGFASGENQWNGGKAGILGVCRWLQARLTIA